ncbi:MAG TPA: SET domain-containing protein [Ferruginibacter sp.]|nr:SET domain-containing protein [Ferruginibacter sp.]
MTKEQLLKELNDDTWVMIRPSPVEGIGVFAIRDIPQGCTTMFSKPDPVHDEWITVPRSDVEQLPQHAKALIENYCLYDDDNYFIAEYGFKKMDLVNFLNHSDTPNIRSVNEGEYFEALRDILAGEELLIDYGEIVDGDE